MKTVLISLITRRKLLIVFFISFLFPLFALTLVSPAYAANPCPEIPQIAQQRNDYNQAAIGNGQYDSNVFQGDSIVYGITDGLNTLLTGCSLIHKETNKATAGTGALAGAGNLITALYAAPPASGVQYFAQKINQFNPTQDAYAANDPGIGFKALSPIQPLWTAFRNVSYLGFVLVFIVIGFMVMFRSKISPQAVATIQDSLPRIVVALILVTFSYALVGLMIDVMFVLLNIFINVLSTIQVNGKSLLNLDAANNVITSNVFSVVMSAQGGIFESVSTSIAKIIQNLFEGGLLVKGLGLLAGGLIGIIAAIAMLFVMFKVFLMLLMAYVTVIILTIFAPFILLFQALPGSNGAKEWFKQIAANLSVFPVVAIMFILAGILGNIPKLGGNGSDVITDQQIGQFPLLTGQLGLQSVGSLIGLGILFMTPSAAKIVKEKFGVKEGAIAAGTGAAMAGFGAGAVAARGIGKGYYEKSPALDPFSRWAQSQQGLTKEKRQRDIEQAAVNARVKDKSKSFYNVK